MHSKRSGNKNYFILYSYFIHTVPWVLTRAITPAELINGLEIACAEDMRFLSYMKCQVCLLGNYWNYI